MYDVFLSGPIADVPEYRERFAVAVCEVRRAMPGASVWNPAELPAGRTYIWYMEQCVWAVFECRSVAMLPGWEASPGARAERALAESLRIPVCAVSEWRGV